MGASVSCPTVVDETFAKRAVGEDKWSEAVELKWQELNANPPVSGDSALEAAKTLGLDVGGGGGAAGEAGGAAAPGGEEDVTKVDTSDVSVRRFVGGLAYHSELGELHEMIRKAEHPDLVRLRRERLHKEAEAAIKTFKDLPEHEKNDAKHQGDLDFYTHDAQHAREELFTSSKRVSRQLEKWWRAASTHFDENFDDVLDFDEYSKFHARLRKLLDEDDELTEEEAEAALEADFHVDAGADREVSYEEFRFAIFQLADHWTASLEEDEYVDFLRKSWRTVFGDLEDADKIQMPPLWKTESAKWSKALGSRGGLYVENRRGTLG